MNPATAPAGSIHLDELRYENEDAVLAAMGQHGLNAFAEPDGWSEGIENRIYPYPELIGAKMFMAAEKAALLGATRWARDGSGDSAADFMARRGDDEMLSSHLAKHAPDAACNPWASNGLDKLWIACAANALEKSLMALADISSAPPEAWSVASKARGPRRGRTFQAMLARERSGARLPMNFMALAIQAHCSPEELMAAARLPGTDTSKLASPWSACAKAWDPEPLRELAASDMPRQGWMKADWREDCRSPWTELVDSHASSSLTDSAVVDRARLLAQAGIEGPDSADLRMALLRAKMAAADEFERLGARPCAQCPQLCMPKAAWPIDPTAPTARLLDWLARGWLDLADFSGPHRRSASSQMPGSSFRASDDIQANWPAQITQTATQAPAELLQRAADQIAMALAGSAKWTSGAEGAFEALFSTDPSLSSIGRDLASLALSTERLAHPQSPSRPTLRAEESQAWWQARILRASLASQRQPAGILGQPTAPSRKRAL